MNEEIEKVIKELYEHASKRPFTIKPKHWWSYLNPFWWKRKKIIEAVIKYQGDNGFWNCGYCL